nr:immunoglobulin heavy chain junction region [Mus musculus]MBK4186627.1 immunoglobulin heavy chain junction region [Mus musculus]MBK4186708.1 immunoglobulin heavy chain junction region [Mus musculus]MBK4188665.1 immunoglobulin heavy chain junction region [Mus musculus]MBK4195034.1 immunoglobulin heavy chain junction region [Mus musculus]
CARSHYYGSSPWFAYW